MTLSRTRRSIVTQRHIAILPTTWGHCGVGWVVPQGLAAASGASPGGPGLLAQIILPGLGLGDLREELSRGAMIREFKPDDAGRLPLEDMPAWWSELVDLLQSYFAAEHGTWRAPKDVWQTWAPRLYLAQLTPFQRDVLEALCAVPAGQVVTYGYLAKIIGRPRAARAVGAALAGNPWPVLAPCHRVIGGTGRLVGFSAPGGVASKARMLAWEEAATQDVKR